VVGVGHSFGAVATLIAAARAPERFRALALLDPTMLDPGALPAARQMLLERGEIRSGLVEGARRRRGHFASVDEAFAYWRGRSLFHDWPDPSLRRYAEAMLRPARTGHGFELAWPREWEAWYYRSFYPDAWDDLARLDPAVPVLVVRGESSDTFLAAAAEHLRKVRPAARLEVLPGHGHLFPHSAPAATADVLDRWLLGIP
jgi:pimeloyl-ACP methyl ester carboxylesterase